MLTEGGCGVQEDGSMQIMIKQVIIYAYVLNTEQVLFHTEILKFKGWLLYFKTELTKS